MAKLSYTAAEIDALLEKVATQGDDVEAIIAAFPFALQRGEYTLNDQSELTFDTLTDTKYYRYTASAIGNPVPGGYGIIVNIRFTAYAVQLLFSQTTATAPTQLLYRIGTGMNGTPAWKAWQTVSTGSGGGGTSVKTLTYTGDGLSEKTITFPDEPTLILKICTTSTTSPFVQIDNLPGRYEARYQTYTRQGSDNMREDGYTTVSNNAITLHGGSTSTSAANVSGREFVVYYI